LGHTELWVTKLMPIALEQRRRRFLRFRWKAITAVVEIIVERRFVGLNDKEL
jgi:hypothetical protein